MNDKVKSIFNNYEQMSKLKTVERQGWKSWGVQGRLESDGEHSNSAAILAYSIKTHYPEKYKDIDIAYVMQMLTFHDTIETFMPDYTPYSDISEEEKRRQTEASIKKVAALFPDSGFVHDMLFEFEDAKTPNGHFAKMVDKLDAALQSKIYDQQGKVDLQNAEAQEMLKKHDVFGRGHKQLSDSWLALETEKDLFDDVFMEIASQTQDTRTEKLQHLTNTFSQVMRQKQESLTI